MKQCNCFLKKLTVSVRCNKIAIHAVTLTIGYFEDGREQFSLTVTETLSDLFTDTLMQNIATCCVFSNIPLIIKQSQSLHNFCI